MNRLHNHPFQYLYLIKAWVVGFLISESVFLSLAVSSKIISYISENNFELITLIVSTIYFVILLTYSVIRGIHQQLLLIIRSKRIDIGCIFFVGLISSFYLNGLGFTVYQKLISQLDIKQTLLLVSLPFFIALAIIIRTVHVWILRKNRNEATFFVSDNEKKTKKEDLLDLYSIAEKFAERVLNLNSSESLVFGIDAPWGVGKSTFVNFCLEYWNEKYPGEMTTYIFNPLKYEDRENLLEKFVDGLIRSIQKDNYVPELKPLISRYSQLIRNVKGSFFGFLNFEVDKESYCVDDAFEDLETVLSCLNRKIIVIIDDLDRLNLHAVKELLFTIKKSFTLPNVTYILCYDAENISSLEQEKPDIEKVSEFLEKFVNVKIGLYLNSEKLLSYLTTNLEKTLSGNSQANPVLVSKAVGGLKDILNSKDFHKYVPFVGDIRKLKRLINIILLLDLEKTDFDNSDFNNHDLIHLLLIYINYPNIFRKIYNSETSGKKGFFSLVSKYEDSYPKDDATNSSSFSESEYKNSTIYTEYIKQHQISDNQKFLLNKVFDVTERLKDTPRSSAISPEARTSYACFNGDIWARGERNLETYLNLIVSSSKPQPISQFKYYLNLKNKLTQGIKIRQVLSDKTFSVSNGESPHKELWRLIINSAHEFSAELGTQLDSVVT